MPLLFFVYLYSTIFRLLRSWCEIIYTCNFIYILLYLDYYFRLVSKFPLFYSNLYSTIFRLLQNKYLILYTNLRYLYSTIFRLLPSTISLGYNSII